MNEMGRWGCSEHAWSRGKVRHRHKRSHGEGESAVATSSRPVRRPPHPAGIEFAPSCRPLPPPSPTHTLAAADPTVAEKAELVRATGATLQQVRGPARSGPPVIQV